MREYPATLLTLLSVLVVGLSPQPVFVQSADDIKAVMRVETDGQPPLDINFSLGHERMRLDMPQNMSIISTTGDNPSTLMIQHADKRYIEWGPQQLEMMQQMLQRGQGGAGGQEADTFDPSTVQFEQTGLTQQIGPWDAFEVMMHGADGQEGALWLTTDAEVGIFEISHRAAEGASMLQYPMAGGGGGPQQFLQLRSLAEAQGLPDGRVVRIVSNDDNGAAIITLLNVETGPLPGDTFEPPAGYEKTQMPVIPGLRD